MIDFVLNFALWLAVGYVSGIVLVLMIPVVVGKIKFGIPIITGIRLWIHIYITSYKEKPDWDGINRIMDGVEIKK